ncbi:DNA polymerase [Staphylococcus phage phiSA_BS2]|uniref:DNA polymerase I n=1 Tax=Staphylococcus phage phiSA_BS2 TaxID=2126724 RepID=A0A2R3ZXV9_9CAUD|nr:DNA polymerase [Staphylococcus phage phiSA_BS2]AVR55586.1 DNA polymerase I [Staphylococcus phage phiSA_BS2]
MTVEEAEDIFNKYYATKPKVKQSIDDVHTFVQENGYVETMNGHRRFLADAQSTDRKKKNEALRQSFNTVIQGGGAYFTNMAITYIDEYIQTRNMRSKLVATVHDSIVVDCPPEEVKTMSKVILTCMENLPFDFLFVDYMGEKIRYPIDADMEIGFNYNDAVEYDEEEIETFKSYQGYIKYHLALDKLSDYFESKKINEEQYKEAIKQVEEQKHLYQEI